MPVSVNSRTPQQIDTFLKERRHRMDLGVQFLGDEPNAYLKDWDSTLVRWLIIASWPYEAAAGNQSVPAVYKTINIAGDEHLADRYYLPASPRDQRTLERGGIPVFGIESKHQMIDFDVVGTSISYPVLIMNFYKFLSMSGIPLRWKDRAANPEQYPMVIVGGQAYGAPEPMAPVIDCFFLGEVEEEEGNPGLATVTERIADFKKRNLWQTDRIDCYRRLALEFDFLYFPRFIDVDYAYEDRSSTIPYAAKVTGDIVPTQLSKQVMSYRSTLEGMRVPFVKRIVKDMDAVVPLDNSPLLFSDPGMGTGDLEVGRGCPAWCSFCALTYRQKPYRQRSVEFMTEFAQRQQRNMGGTHLTPFMPDFPMHTKRKALIASLLENVSDEVDAPAMRVDDFISDPECILLQVHGGMDGVTLGVEGNSQRMRDLVGKGCADEDIKEAVARGMRAGIRKFKLFMISNMPGEDEGDIFRILALARDLADIRDSMDQPSVRIQFSWTPLLIEANTPFQWFAIPTSARALGDVWEEFRDIKIDFKLGGKSEPNKAAFFQLCQRASREVGEAIVDACEVLNKPLEGGTWGGVPKTTAQTLEDKLIEHGFLNGFDDCYDERFKHDMFGWEFISQGISPEMLWVTYLQMREFVEQTDSATYDLNFNDDYHGNEWIERCDTKCYGKTCGTCDVEDLKIRRGYIQGARSERDVDLNALKVVDQKSQAVRVRARLMKFEDKRYVMNDHWRFHLRRAAYMAMFNLDTKFGITKRSIKFASDSVNYKDWTCGVDYVEFGLTEKTTAAKIEEFITEMNKELTGVELREWTFHPASSLGMRADIDLSLWELELDEEPSKVLAKVKAWGETSYVKMILKQEAQFFAAPAEEVNAKDFCDDLWLVRDGHRLLLRLLLRGRPSPYNVYAALMGRASWIEAAKMPAVRLEAFVPVDKNQQDFFRHTCEECEMQIPTNVMDESYDTTHCPRCKDQHSGRIITEVSFV